MTIYNIRAHHLLCIQGYQGYGYSDEFNENMRNIIKEINKKENKIKILNIADDICKKCPNLKENFCKNQKEDSKIKYMDNYILDKLQYSEEDLNFKKAIIKLKTALKKEDIDTICNNCSWIKECLFYQKTRV